MHGLAARDRGIDQRLFSMAISRAAALMPFSYRNSCAAASSLELPPETRVDVLTVQRIRRGSNHTFGEKDKKQEGGEGMVKSVFAERNSEQITNATRTGVDWVQELTEQ